MVLPSPRIAATPQWPSTLTTFAPADPVVRIEPHEFEDLVQRIRDPLVLYQEPVGMFSRNHVYATSYRGFIFLARSRNAIFLPDGVEAIPVKKIWMPD